MAGSFGQPGPLALALTTGAVTAFNPCGFAMLPAYVSYYLGADSSDTGVPGDRSSKRKSVRANPVARSFVVSGCVTLGFITVFGLLGLAASGLQSTVIRYMPYVSMVVGVALVALGIAMFRGFTPKLPLLGAGQARSGNGFVSMYLYGVSFALVSLSCSFATFLSAVAASFRESSFGRALLIYVAFAAGMGLVMLLLTVAVSLARQSAVRAMRRVGKYMNRIAAVLLVVTGVYVAWYGLVEYRLLIRNDGATTVGPIDSATRFSGRVQDWLSGIAPAYYLVAGVVVIGLFFAQSIRTKPSSASTSTPSETT